MRPIETPPLPEHRSLAPRGALLLGALGDYCSICERRIPAEFWVLDTRTGRVHDPMETEGWGGLLLLCHDCTAAHQAAGGGVDGLLLPGAQPTFRLEGESPFAYAMEEVTVVLLDEAGDPASTAAGERVIVRGTTPAARATILHFALNTAYFDEATATFRVPYWAQSTRFDRRVDQRTDAWRETEFLVAQLEPGRYARVLLNQGRRLLAAQGFWSTAATVLWARLGDRGRVARLLFPDLPPPPAPAIPSPTAGAASAQSSAADAADAFTRVTAYPGTRADWL